VATGLLVENGRCTGVAGLDPDGTPSEVRADHVVLASGGAGQLFAVTTNPPLSTGDGVAMALAAGAAVADIEFMQFHPTALHHPATPKPLLSEALRGEGARLRDEQGVAFMASEHPLADLAPRDVVARAITRRLIDRGLDHLWLDATGIDGFAARFPTIWRNCRAVGLDPGRDWLPVAPAAHYLCGGVVTDLDGAASLPGLWACGEVSCTGVHGANRLASNSLLEGLVFGHRVAAAIIRGKTGPESTGAMRGVDYDGAPVPSLYLAARDQSGPPVTELREGLQRLMTAKAGVLRDAAGLDEALLGLDRIETQVPAGGGRDVCELRNLIVVGRALVLAAAERQESRGTHQRLDFPEKSRRTERIVHLGSRGRVPVPAAVATSDRER
jgi:L-aspartate oxidase